MKWVGIIKSNKDVVCEEVFDKVLAVQAKHQLYQAYLLLDMFKVEILKLELRIKFLKRKKPFSFQKKKLDIYNDDLNELQDKIQHYKIKVDDQNKLIDELKTFFKELTGFDYVYDVSLY